MQQTLGEELDLVDFYKMRFGQPGSSSYISAINNLADSLAAYSLVCYIL